MKNLKLIFIFLSLVICINGYSQFKNVKYTKHTYSCLGTFSPPKNGVGIVGSYNNYIASSEISFPRIHNEQMTLAKYTLGFKILNKKTKGYDIPISGVYNHILNYEGYRLFLNPDNLHLFSIEIGLIIEITKTLIASFHLDALNHDTKVGFGIKLN